MRTLVKKIVRDGLIAITFCFAGYFIGHTTLSNAQTETTTCSGANIVLKDCIEYKPYSQTLWPQGAEYDRKEIYSFNDTGPNYIHGEYDEQNMKFTAYFWVGP